MPANPGTDPPAAAPELEDRVTRIEAGLDRLTAAIENAGGAAHADAAAATETRLDRPTTVEEQVRAALAQADADRAAADEKAQLAAGVAETRAALAKLTETPPEEPVSRLRRVMYGGRP